MSISRKHIKTINCKPYILQVYSNSVEVFHQKAIDSDPTFQKPLATFVQNKICNAFAWPYDPRTAHWWIIAYYKNDILEEAQIAELMIVQFKPGHQPEAIEVIEENNGVAYVNPGAGGVFKPGAMSFIDNNLHYEQVTKCHQWLRSTVKILNENERERQRELKIYGENGEIVERYEGVYSVCKAESRKVIFYSRIGVIHIDDSDLPLVRKTRFNTRDRSFHPIHARPDLPGETELSNFIYKIQDGISTTFFGKNLATRSAQPKPDDNNAKKVAKPIGLGIV